jgi:hypothetical protein
VAGARSAAAGALMEASAAEDVIAAECCAGRKYRTTSISSFTRSHSQLLAIYHMTGSLWNRTRIAHL